MIQSVGIIGFGQMGKIFAELFSRGFDVRVFDIKPIEKIGHARVTSLKNACQADLVILCVPIDSFEDTCKTASRFIGQNSLVMDTCSVKQTPTKQMVKTFGPKISVLGTHPLFGPNSQNHKKIILCPVRIKDQKLQEIEGLFNKLGFETFVMSSKEHDQLMAKTQIFTHICATLAQKMQIQNTKAAPESFKLMMQSFLMASPNSNLLNNMFKENVFARKLLRELVHEMNLLEKICHKNQNRIIC